MIMKALNLFAALFLPAICFAQLQVNFDEKAIQEDFVTNLDIYSEAYVDPILDVYSYNQLGGWATTAELLNPWNVRLQFVSSVTFVPDENLQFNFNEQGFTGFSSASPGSGKSEIRLQAHSDNPYLPTVLGGSTEQMFIYSVKDENGVAYSEEFPVFEGTSTPFNAVPDIVPQISLGLPAGFEVNLRYFPKLELSGVDHQHWGAGLRHQLNQYVWDDENFHWSVGGTFSRNSYAYFPDEFLEGSDQEVRLRSDAFMLESSISYDLPILSLFASASYFSWQNNFDILGTYRYEVAAATGPLGAIQVKEAFSVEDPVSVTKENTGLRFTAGATVSIFKYLGLTMAYSVNPRSSLMASININFVD